MNIYDIAAEAGTSISTVSRVLNKKENINPATRQRVEEVLKKYDYKPSAIARGMVSKSMKSIAILTVDVRVIHYARMIYVIEQEFSKHGYNVTVCSTGGSIKECGKYLQILTEKQTDGMILIGSVFNDLEHEEEMIASIRNIPVVIANGNIDRPNFYSVLVDDLKTMRLAVDHLWDGGRHDLVYLFDPKNNSAREKKKGFLEGLKLHDVPQGEKHVLTFPNSLEGGMQAADMLLDTKFPCNGIVCGEDITAIGVIKRLKQRGIAVPKDIAVTGCNNSPDALICDPELTSVDNKPELLGKMCAGLLKDLIEGKEVNTHIAIQPELIVRESSL